MAASFQIEEAGFEHQIAMPDVPPPEESARCDRTFACTPRGDAASGCRHACGASSRRRGRSSSARCSESITSIRTKQLPQRQVWFRAVGRLPDEQMLHRCLLAYVSDFYLLDTATLPHGTSFLQTRLIMASIDHAMWFHRALRVDEWLLYALDSPSASGARGFARASVLRAMDGWLRARRRKGSCAAPEARLRGLAERVDRLQQERVEARGRLHHQKVAGPRHDDAAEGRVRASGCAHRRSCMCRSELIAMIGTWISGSTDEKS